MAIARKPQTSQKPAPPVDVDALIAKGGSVATRPTETNSATPDETATASFTLRVPREILRTVDDHRNNQSYKVPRQQWIIEAIMQRLEREIASENKPQTQI